MWPKLTGYAYEIRSAGEPYLSQLLEYAESVCKQLEWTGLAWFDFVWAKTASSGSLISIPGSGAAAERDAVGKGRPVRRAGPLDPRRDRRSPEQAAAGHLHRVFPKYTFEPSGMSPWRRLGGLRDAPGMSRPSSSVKR